MKHKEFLVLDHEGIKFPEHKEVWVPENKECPVPEQEAFQISGRQEVSGFGTSEGLGYSPQQCLHKDSLGLELKDFKFLEVIVVSFNFGTQGLSGSGTWGH